MSEAKSVSDRKKLLPGRHTGRHRRDVIPECACRIPLSWARTGRTGPGRGSRCALTALPAAGRRAQVPSSHIFTEEAYSVGVIPVMLLKRREK